MKVEAKKPARVWPVLRAYSRAALKYPGALFIAVLSVVGIQVAAVISPLYLKQFINVIAAGVRPGVFQSLLWILAIYTLINIGAWICQRVRMLTLGHTEARVMTDLYNQAFTYLLGHSHDFFISNFTGTLTRRVTRYARSFESVLDNVLLNFIPTLLFVIGVVVVLSLRNLWIGMGLLIWTIVFIYIQYKMVTWLQPLRTKRIEEDSRMMRSRRRRRC